MMDTDTLGFVGLGDMGAPMAANLSRGGFPLIVYDKAGTESRAPSGVDIAAGIADVARMAYIVFVSVPDASASLEVALGLIAVKNRRTQTLVNLSNNPITTNKHVRPVFGVRPCIKRTLTKIKGPVFTEG